MSSKCFPTNLYFYLNNKMLKQILIISLLSVILSLFFGDQAIGIITSIFFKSLSPLEKPKLEKLFTKEDLKLYNGVDRAELYLAIAGIVYDVSKGKKHYGPAETYNFFVGKDASRSFVTGKFDQKDSGEHVADFNFGELRSLNHWIQFYKKDYKRMGKLIGKYYDESGKLTPYGKQVKKLIKEAEKQKENEDLEKQKFPPCNVEWDAEKGTRVWCSSRSGGIVRSWVGKPRKLYEVGANDFRCACISDENRHLGNIQEYEDCDENSDSCYVKQ